MAENNSKLEADRRLLVEARSQGKAATTGAFLKLSGPGWLQSALTLGGGSLASSLYLGVLAGFTMMWLQPLAMILGIIMLSTIGYVTMSTGERPFRAINNHVNPVLGWAWLLASMAANMVWALPQYSLMYGVLEQNLMPETLGPDGALAGETGKWVISIIALIFSTIIVWSYGSGSWGIKLYELMLKLVVAMIVVCFFGVVIKMSMTEGGIAWNAVFAGFIPKLSQLFEPAPEFQPLLDAIADIEARAYWTAQLISEQRDVMISAAATAVGINMTFLLPYSILARGWDKDFRSLAVFDLSTGMFIPFLLATSCVIIASATQFHAQTPTSFVLPEDGSIAPSLEKVISARQEVVESPVSSSEQIVAAALTKRDAIALAKSLEPLTGAMVANLIFGIGVVGMTLSTISLLMLISGFVVCEVLDVPPTGWTHRLGSLAAASGILWPLLWADDDARFWLAIVTSVFGMALLPIAYLTFFLLINQRSLLKDELPQGGKRVLWNILIAIAAGAATAASGYVVWSKSGWYGTGAVAALLALTLVVQLLRSPQHDSA